MKNGGWGWLALAVLGFAVIPIQVIAPSGAAAVLGLVAIICGCRLAVRREFAPIWSNSLIVTISVILLWCIVSAIWSIHVRMPIKQIGVMAALAVTWATIVRSDPRDLRRARRWIVAGLVVGITMVLIEHFSNGALNTIVSVGLTPVLGKGDGWREPQLNRAIALSALVACPVLWSLWRSGPKWLVGVIAAAVVAGVALGPSASLKIALAAGIVAFLGTRLLGRRFIHAMTVVAVAGLVLAPLWVKTIVTPENLHAAMPNIRLSALERTYFWDFAIDRTAERPLLGWGYDTSRHLPGGDQVLETDIFHTGGTEHKMGTHPHNWFVQTWVELGGVGVVLLAALLVAVDRLAARCTEDRSLQAAMAGCMAFALVAINLVWGMWQSAWLSSLGIACLMFSFVIRLADPTRTRMPDMGRPPICH